jgi:hypothetical protein
LGDARWHHRGLLLRAIEVIGEINGFAFDIFQQTVGSERLKS